MITQTGMAIQSTILLTQLAWWGYLYMGFFFLLLLLRLLGRLARDR